MGHGSGIFACVLLAVFRACLEPLIDCLADLLTDYSHGNKENDMNLQVIDLIEGFDMDVAYDCDTQLDKPIVFAGAGFYSMNDAGVFVFDHERRPSMPTYSRIKVTDPDA